MNEISNLLLKSSTTQVYLSPIGGYKDPWLAVNLSMFFPGLGQLYGGKNLRGSIWIIIQIFLIICGFWSIFSAGGQTALGLICLGLAVAVYLGSIFDAHLCVYGQSRQRNREKIPRQEKNPWFGVFASRIMPGLGHFYNQQTLLGLFFLSTGLVFLQLGKLSPNFSIVPPLLSAIATYHAYITFPGSGQGCHLSQRSLVAIMAGVIFAWGLISNQIPEWIEQKLELFMIPSESMQPTLQVNDRVFVRQSPSYRPQRGDVIVFKPTEVMESLEPTSTSFYIKRVVATPGEKVEIRSGVVYVDDRPLKEDYIAQAPNYDLEAAVVPANHYFVLGDNRNYSFDSHVWGFLPRENIFGQAYKIYWPLERVKSLIAGR